MNFNNQYCAFKKGLPIEFCNKIISQATNQNKNKASVSNKDSTKRISNITWLDESWIYETLKPYIDKANKDCGWNLQWDYTEKAQFTEYEKGQYYKWHIDQLDKPYGERFGKDWQGKVNGSLRQIPNAWRPALWPGAADYLDADAKAADPWKRI